MSEDANKSIHEISKIRCVDRRSVSKVLKKYEETKSVENVHRGGKKRKLNEKEVKSVQRQAKKGKLKKARLLLKLLAIWPKKAKTSASAQFKGGFENQRFGGFEIRPLKPLQKRSQKSEILQRNEEL